MAPTDRRERRTPHAAALETGGHKRAVGSPRASAAKSSVARRAHPRVDRVDPGPRSRLGKGRPARPAPEQGVRAGFEGSKGSGVRKLERACGGERGPRVGELEHPRFLWPATDCCSPPGAQARSSAARSSRAGARSPLEHSSSPARSSPPLAPSRLSKVAALQARRSVDIPYEPRAAPAAGGTLRRDAAALRSERERTSRLVTFPARNVCGSVTRTDLRA